MEHFDLEYLKNLLKETNIKRQNFQFYEPDEKEADITYLPTSQKIFWPGRIDSLFFRYEVEKCGTCEKSTLRRSCKNYIRFVRKDGQLLRIDSYVNGRLDVIQIVHYEDNKRFCFPFSSTGSFYPTYVEVVQYNDSKVIEEYMVQNTQILYRAYQPAGKGKTQMRYINYVPEGTEPVIYKEIGYFTESPMLTYTETDSWFWMDERN